MTQTTTSPPATSLAPRRTSRARTARVRQLRRGATTILVALALWQLLPTLGLVDSFLVPPPSVIAQRLVELAGPGAEPQPFALALHVGWSILRLVCGVAIGCVLGIPLGFAMAANRVVDRVVRPVLSVTLPIPSLAWAPILILYLGLNNKTTIAVVAIEATLLMAYNAAMGASSVPQSMKWAVQSMGGRRGAVFWKVVLPASVPPITTAMKLSTGYGWRALVAAESLAATAYGLGFIIFQAQSYLDTKTIFAGILTIAVVGFVLERVVFGRIERRINTWYATTGSGR